MLRSFVVCIILCLFIAPSPFIHYSLTWFRAPLEGIYIEDSCGKRMPKSMPSGMNQKLCHTASRAVPLLRHGAPRMFTGIDTNQALSLHSTLLANVLSGAGLIVVHRIH